MARTPGAKGKVHRDIKDNIMEVYELLGGTQGLYAFAQEYPQAFYLGIFAKLIPKNVEANIAVTSLEQLVAASAESTDLIIEGDSIKVITSKDADRE